LCFEANEKEEKGEKIDYSTSEKLNLFDDNLTEENFENFLKMKDNFILFRDINLYNSIYDEDEINNDNHNKDNNNNNNSLNSVETKKEKLKEYIIDLNKKFNLNFIYIYEHYFFWFKNFFQKILETENVLINGENYISKIWKYYIAIITVSSGKSEYLLKVLEERFLVSGGDKNWLIYGLEIVPLKLRKISKLVNIISHQPWNIMEDDLKVNIKIHNLSYLKN
jgi:hypothetical protein